MPLPTSVLTALTRATEPRTAAIGIGAGRTLVGVGAGVAPVPAGRMVGLDTASARRAATLARMAGARDVAIGVATVLTAVRGGDVRPWLLAGAAADAADTVIIGSAVGRGRLSAPLGWVSVAAALGGAVGGFVAAARRPAP